MIQIDLPFHDDNLPLTATENPHGIQPRDAEFSTDETVYSAYQRMTVVDGFKPRW